jgi:hypothetical protein
MMLKLCYIIRFFYCNIMLNCRILFHLAITCAYLVIAIAMTRALYLLALVAFSPCAYGAGAHSNCAIVPAAALWRYLSPDVRRADVRWICLFSSEDRRAGAPMPYTGTYTLWYAATAQMPSIADAVWWHAGSYL